jgi:hypothetical protein
MRSIGIVAMLGAVALAAPARKPPPSWADWVGTYEGKLSWKACSAAGEKTAAIPLVAIDGAMAIDLAPAHAGLRTVSLVEGDAVWSAQQGDFMLAIKRPRANAIDLTVELSSGCTLKAQLRRTTTNVAACDRLLGWARIEASCSKLPAGATEDLGKLAVTKWRKTDAASCTTRADKLERSLVDAGCAPHPDPLVGVRAPACLALADATSRLDRCASVPPNVKKVFVLQGQATVSASQTAEASELAVVEAECRDLRTTVIAVGTQFRCTNM